MARQRRVLRSDMRPGRQPRPPRPQPAPHHWRGGGGVGLGARPPLRLRSPGSPGRSAGFGYCGLLRSPLGADSVRLLRPQNCEDLDCRRRSRYHPEDRSRSPRTCGRNERAGGARRPHGFTRSSPSEPQSPMLPSLLPHRGGCCRSCHSSSPPSRKAAEPSRVGIFPRGNPDRGGATERARTPSENNYSGFALSTGWGGT